MIEEGKRSFVIGGADPLHRVCQDLKLKVSPQVGRRNNRQDRTRLYIQIYGFGTAWQARHFLTLGNVVAYPHTQMFSVPISIRPGTKGKHVGMANPLGLDLKRRKTRLERFTSTLGSAPGGAQTLSRRVTL